MWEIVVQRSRSTQTSIWQNTNLQSAVSSSACHVVKSTVTHMFSVLLAGIMQGVHQPVSVYSIMPPWWHLILLQYVAECFHLPSVRTTMINTQQYPEPQKPYEIPTIPAVVKSKMVFPQFNIMAAFVHSHINFFCGVSPVLPTYNNLHITQFKFKCNMIISRWPHHTCLNSRTVNIQQFILNPLCLPSAGDKIIQLNNKLWMLNCSSMKFNIHN